MRKLVYRVWNNDEIVLTVTTLKDKREAESYGLKVTEDFEEVKDFQPWKKKKEYNFKYPYRDKFVK